MLMLLSVAVVAAGLLRIAAQRPVAHAAGVLVDSAPRQTDPVDPTPLRHGDYLLQPLADFTIEARVLSREDYRFDEGASLSPTDLALGWGRMSDSAVIDKLDIRQSVRFFTWHWRDAQALAPAEVVRSATNLHAIPADAAIARALARVRVGEIVELRGRLVEASRADGWHWRSSLSRDDSGAGACELMLVEAIERR
ncbi:hypothetical protein EV148_101746 [Dokdonella fugitiva]|uniref:Uncharacterized protein n=2 Tax=Dokdonella fugitiva TaxID=328517 RepID=A0A4R2IGG9_9GAMM|nr:hypothetical protein EV148_101746 [Dokdonella fugitiva]